MYPWWNKTKKNGLVLAIRTYSLISNFLPSNKSGFSKYFYITLFFVFFEKNLPSKDYPSLIYFDMILSY